MTKPLRCFDTPRRTLRIGVSHHILGADLSHWLEAFGPGRSGGARRLQPGHPRQMLESYEEGALDIALILRHDNRRQDGEVIGSERFGWMAADTFELEDGALPLAIQPAPCGACAAWSVARWRAPAPVERSLRRFGILAIGAAVSAGIGIGAMVERMAPAGCVDVRARFDLCRNCRPAMWCSTAPTATPRPARWLRTLAQAIAA